jgi:hypothetical protein
MSDKLWETVKACRICGNGSLDVVLDLGAQPPANSLRQSLSEDLPAVPLVLCRCDACGTLQLTETVAPEYLFRHYNWVTGTSATTHGYSYYFCDAVLSRCLKPPRFAVEVASNDGTFLKRFADSGIKVLGVDPARNIAEIAEQSGVPTVADFFGVAVAKRIIAEHGHADAVFARNVIPHVADPRDVVGGMAHCLSADGTGAIEFHRADVILNELHYDSIYHEHLFYHSLQSMQLLLHQCELSPFDVSFSPISGGSCVVYFSKTGRKPTAEYLKMQEFEQKLGIGEVAPWQEFARRCERHRSALKLLVESAKRCGKRLIGYGASARSSTLLNYCGIDHRHLDVIADRSQLKHGRYTPGTNILITSPAEAFTRRPDGVLMLAWNFHDEILLQIRSEQGWQGEVIQPLPGEPQAKRLA